MSLTLAVLLSLAPQSPAVALPIGMAQRYVDFSADLERPQVSVVLGRLGELKEGKRERLPDAVLGSSTAQVSVSGTQYFKVPATAALEVDRQLAGRALPGKAKLEFELQLARLPDGKERRQVIGGNGAPLEKGMLALWVVELWPRHKGLQVLHVIPFDPDAERGEGAERAFVDTMHDYVTVNLRVRDLRLAIAAVDAAEGDARLVAKAALQKLLDQKPELRRPANDGLLAQHVAPLETRARNRLQQEDK